VIFFVFDLKIRHSDLKQTTLKNDWLEADDTEEW
jgi:hypothetical protein